MGTGNSRLMSYDDALEALNQSERTLIQKTWQQLVDETGAQNAAGSTTVEEIQVHRGYFNRSLLGGRFPQALEVRRRPSSPLSAPSAPRHLTAAGRSVLARSGSSWRSGARTARS